MKLEFRDLYLNVDVNEESYVTSPHTDTKLKEFEVSSLIKDHEQKAIEDCLIHAREHNLYEVDSDYNRKREYEIIDYSNHYQDLSDVLNYVIKIRQVEELEAEKIIIDDLELTPYAYNETYDEDRNAILITAKVDVSKQIGDQLEEMSYENYDYHSIVREGINKEPIKMRFGRNVWSSDQEENNIKYEIVLIEDKYDKKNNQAKLTDYPVLQNLQYLSVYQQSYIDLLEELLIEKDILTKDDLNQMKSKAHKVEKENRKYLYRVDDVDEEEL